MTNSNENIVWKTASHPHPHTPICQAPHTHMQGTKPRNESPNWEEDQVGLMIIFTLKSALKAPKSRAKLKASWLLEVMGKLSSGQNIKRKTHHLISFQFKS